MWESKSARVIGGNPSAGTREAFQFAMGRPECRASEFANQKGISSANASMKFKQLWNEGFLLGTGWRGGQYQGGGTSLRGHR